MLGFSSVFEDTPLRGIPSKFSSTDDYEKGHHTWCGLVLQLSSITGISASSVTPSLSLGWDVSTLECSGGTRVGVVLRRVRLGALVAEVDTNLPMSSSGVLPGSVLLDVNGCIVIFESFTSI